ncbi:MAG: hypothetical protein R8L53_09045 [Mariprofundales bacterium]
MGLKIAIVVLGAIFIFAMVGGFYKMQQDREKSFQLTIGQLQQQVADMTAENNALRNTNASLNANIQLKNEERMQVQLELEKLRLTDAQTQQQVADMEKQLQDKERSARLDVIRKGRKASLLLKFANKAVACEMEHFEDDGVCRAGRWQATVKKTAIKTKPADTSKTTTAVQP